MRNFFYFSLHRRRSSHRSCFTRKCVLKNFAKFTEKYLCWSPFFSKVAGLRPVTSLKKRSDTVIFLGILRNFQKHLFFRTRPRVTASTCTASTCSPFRMIVVIARYTKTLPCFKVLLIILVFVSFSDLHYACIEMSYINQSAILRKNLLF